MSTSMDLTAAALPATTPLAATAEDMTPIPGGTFRTGSDKHYREQAPAERVTVDPVWIAPATIARSGNPSTPR